MSRHLNLLAATLLSALTFFSVLSCRQNNDSGENPSVEFATYVKAYTGNMINAGTPVRIELVSAPAKTDQTGLFSFTPSIKGEVRWLSPTIVEFVPDEGEMAAGRSYKAEFALHRLYDIKEDRFRTFAFNFATASRDAGISIDGVTVTEGDKSKAMVAGCLTASEPISAQTARKMLSARLQGGEAEISLDDHGDNTTHSFYIRNIERADQDKELEIRLEGRKAGFSGDMKVTAVIPGINEFKVLEASLVNGKDPYIEVRFSEPMDETADYTGLFNVIGSSRQYLEVKDNIVKVYFEIAEGKEISILIDASVKSNSSKRLSQDWSQNFGAVSPKPAVEMSLDGTILPDISALVLPFKAVNLSAVDLSVIRIYEDNVLTFLQDNDLSGDYQIRRSGRLTYRKTIRLDADRDKDLSKWQKFSIDLSGVIKNEPGAIYRVRLSFKEEYSLYGKDPETISADNSMINLSDTEISEEETAVWDTPVPYYYGEDIDWSQYHWRDRDDPTTPSYYMVSGRFPECNLLASNIGIIVKSADNGVIWVNINDIISTKPLEKVKVTAYNFQRQKIGSSETDAEGSAKINVAGKPFVIVAEQGKVKSYLKVTDGHENSLSRFDTGGRKIEKGLKGFIYGERGVWRPGDTLHLNLIIDATDKKIPDNHPASVELYTPQGQFYSRQICNESRNGFYKFDIVTEEADPTGTWNAYFKIGGATFHKALPIETIKPNRLKIKTDLQTDILTGDKSETLQISSSWLTGPAASGLKATAEMKLKPATGAFKGFDGYIFKNPSADFSATTVQIADVTLDSKGKASVTFQMPPAANAPGILTADIVTRVMEPGGDISITSQSIPYSPFKAYVGVKMPQTDGDWYETDKNIDMLIATVDKNGQRVIGHNIEYVIYKLGWYWWWENKGGSIESYVNSGNAEAQTTVRYVSGDRDEVVRFRLDYPDWGRYYLYVKDLDSGHSCGATFTVDWPTWRGRAERNDPEALTMLTFATDKKEYEVGEEATVFIPAAKGGRALVSIETGSTVLSRTWVKTSENGDTPYKFRITKDMSPNFYIHITLLQPHSQSANNLPIRMYGVQPVTVSDKASVLQPQIDMPDILRPQEPFKIKIREKQGRTMTYTLAIVDEGLLDITAFKTPDPWTSMHAREALGIRTWDLYDDVAGAYSGRLAPMFSTGGDENLIKDGKQDNRFNPVVKFIGPFVCKGTATHTVTLPMYVGSVRVMVIAGQDGAYGNAEKTVPVRSPLMVLPTAPRVLGVGETISIPVNVFAMEDNIKKVKVTLQADGPAEIISESAQELTFTSTGDKLAGFSIRPVGEGKVKLTVKAEGNGAKAEETIYIDSRNPNPGRLNIQRKVLQSGEEVTFNWGDGMDYEWAKVEAAGFPAIDFNGIFRYVTDYSHYCTEQLCSRGISLLYIWDMLDKKEQEEASETIGDILQLLYSRQLPDGGFAYWPGNHKSDTWVSSMAGQFMTKAASKGYAVDKGILNGWKKYQNKALKAYRHSGRYDLNDLDQAYRLYTLALAGSPDNGAMNRLKESLSSSDQAKWMLASAYSLCGKKSIASEMLSGTSTDISAYPEADKTFGSAVRDKALALEAYVLADDLTRAMDIAEEVGRELSIQGYTTQTAAFACVAMGRLNEKMTSQAADITITQEKASDFKSAKARASWEISAAYGKAKVRNNSDEAVYISVATYGRPSYESVMPSKASGLLLEVTYKDMSGNVIHPAFLTQGTDFTVEMTVANTSQTDDYRDLALTMAIPSGWEIFNDRLYGNRAEENGPSYAYNDIRDDRTSFYFDLPKGHRKTFKARLTAVYSGTFVLPSVKCEAMYDNGIYAYSASGHTVVTE